MNDKVGLLSWRQDREQFDKPYSNETAHLVDTEVRPQALHLPQHAAACGPRVRVRVVVHRLGLG